MIENMIELFLVLACLQTSGELTCNQYKQLQDEWYRINCTNPCVEDQNEAEEEEEEEEEEQQPENYGEVDKVIEFYETPIRRPSWSGCEQRQNETEKPTNCGMFLGRNKRQQQQQQPPRPEQGQKFLTCEVCRMTEKIRKQIDCEMICAKECTECESKRKETGIPPDCGHLCGEWIMPCHQCRRKEMERKIVDCELSCVKSCHDCEKRNKGSEQYCQNICGSPRLPCEECRNEQKTNASINCEWTCESSCLWCVKLEKRMSAKFDCVNKYCGRTQPCLGCRRKLNQGSPYDCAEKCEIPCLTCRTAQQSGRIVNCHDTCVTTECSVPCEESTCLGCIVDKNTTGSSEECQKYCMDRASENTDIIIPRSCNECRQREKKGEDIDCEFSCESECRECMEKQMKSPQPLNCERVCGTPPHPCLTCWHKLKQKEMRDCEWACASSCTMCEMVKKGANAAQCGMYCGVPRLPCSTCRRSEMDGKGVDCTKPCETPCNECQRSPKTKHCAMLCGMRPQGAPGNKPTGTLDCVSCNGIIERACNIPYEHNDRFKTKCEKQCVLIELVRQESKTGEDDPASHYIMRGCDDVVNSVPQGYSIKVLKPCSQSNCNTNDKLLLAPPPATGPSIQAGTNERESASETHRIWVHLKWLLFIHYSVF